MSTFTKILILGAIEIHVFYSLQTKIVARRHYGLVLHRYQPAHKAGNGRLSRRANQRKIVAVSYTGE